MASAARCPIADHACSPLGEAPEVDHLEIVPAAWPYRRERRGASIADRFHRAALENARRASWMNRYRWECSFFLLVLLAWASLCRGSILALHQRADLSRRQDNFLAAVTPRVQEPARQCSNWPRRRSSLREPTGDAADRRKLLARLLSRSWAGSRHDGDEAPGDGAASTRGTSSKCIRETHRPGRGRLWTSPANSSPRAADVP